MIYREARAALFANTAFIVAKYADFHQIPRETRCTSTPGMIKHIEWTVAIDHLQRRWNNGDLGVNKTLFPGLESLELHCSAPNCSERDIRGFNVTYNEGCKEMLQLGMGHVGWVAVPQTRGGAPRAWANSSQTD